MLDLHKLHTCVIATCVTTDSTVPRKAEVAGVEEARRGGASDLSGGEETP